MIYKIEPSLPNIPSDPRVAGLGDPRVAAFSDSVTARYRECVCHTVTGDCREIRIDFLGLECASLTGEDKITRCITSSP